MRSLVVHIALLLLLAVSLTAQGRRVDTLTTVTDTACLDVWFRVNRTVLDPTYLDNRARLARFHEAMQPIVDLSAGDIDTIVIRGAASPEGPYANNARLARERAAELRYYISKTYGIAYDHFRLEPETENWVGLRQAIQAGTAPYRERVLRLLTEPLEYVTAQRSAELKRALMALDGGRVWRDMLHTVYPRLRLSANCIIIAYRLHAARPQGERLATLPAASCCR